MLFNKITFAYHVHTMYICSMKNKQLKKSKRLEFTPTEIKRFDKKAKQAKSNFKVYAENIIKAIGNDELILTVNNNGL